MCFRHKAAIIYDVLGREGGDLEFVDLNLITVPCNIDCDNRLYEGCTRAVRMFALNQSASGALCSRCMLHVAAYCAILTNYELPDLN